LLVDGFPFACLLAKPAWILIFRVVFFKIYNLEFSGKVKNLRPSKFKKSKAKRYIYMGKKQWAKAYKTCMGRWYLTLPAQLCNSDCVRVAISSLYQEFITNTCMDTQMNPGIRNNAGVPAKQGGCAFSPPPRGGSGLTGNINP